MTDRLDSAARLTIENLGRALDLHQSWGAITRWECIATRRPARWIILLPGPSGGPGRTLGLNSKRDVGLVVTALNAARHIVAEHYTRTEQVNP